MMVVHLTSHCKAIHCHVRWLQATRSDCLQLLIFRMPFVTYKRQSSYRIAYPNHPEAVQSRTGAMSFQSWRQRFLHTRTCRSPNTLPPDTRNWTAYLKRSSMVAASIPLLQACYYSRLLRNAERSKKPARTIKVKDFLLIDEDGNNLGVMPRDTALQLAESKGLEVLQVKKETLESKAVCKLVSRKQIWDQEKRQKQASKKDPKNVTKEVTISTSIAEHDLAVKVNQMKGFLEKTHSVRVSIDPQVGLDKLCQHNNRCLKT